MANPWIENKGRKRAPFKAGTLIDVRYNEAASRYGVECGGPSANDWSVEGVAGDITHYRLHEEIKDEQE